MALDNFKKTSMRIDKANQRFLDYQNAKVGDVNGRELLVQITNNGVVEDQTGTTLKLNWQHENGNQGSTNFKVVDIKTGKYSLYYPKEMLYKGIVDASVEITSGGQTTNTMNFKIIVHADVFNGEAGMVDGVFISLADVNKKLDDREKEYKELKERQTSVETQFNSIQQEITNKDVVSAPEIIVARNGEANLKDRLDKEHQNVTEQLSQTAKYNIQPLYVETLVSFGRFGIGSPLGVANYTGGKYELKVNGVAGNDYFTVTQGNIADAGATTNWAAVLEKNDSTYEGYRVMGTDGINKVYVYPNVRENVTGAVLANLHDSKQGQHYTEKGYKAFGQHIFNNSGYYSQRLKYIDRFLGADTASNWVGIGVSNFRYDRGLSPVDLVDGMLKGDGDRVLTYSTSAVGDGIEWEVLTDKNTGYFEGYIGIHSGSSVKVEFYVNGVLRDSKVIKKEVERVVFDYSYGDKAKVKISSETDNATTVRVGNCYWWTTSPVPTRVFNTTANKAVYLGDSWGTYHNGATPKEIERLWKLDNPTATVINRSQGGMTTKYGRMWFNDYVLANKPDIVIIEYFTNDSNTIANPNSGTTFTGPDGQTYSTVVTENEYHENLRWMIDTAIYNGIQPIVVMPAPVESQVQTQYHSQQSVRVANGSSMVSKSGAFNEVTSQHGTFNKLLTDEIETKTEVNVPLQITPSTAGVVIKPRLTMYAGTPFKMENGGSELLSVSILSGTGYTRDANLSITAITLKPLDVLPAASITHRGRIVAVNGGVGVEDKMYRCVKNAADTYEWKEL